MCCCFTEDCFHETVEAMVHLGINTERQSQIFRVRYSSSNPSNLVDKYIIKHLYMLHYNYILVMASIRIIISYL